MAKAKKTKQQSTSEKLRSLYEMQVIDKEYDRIQRLKGELPLEVEDLEDEITGIENRITRTNEEFAELETELAARDEVIQSLLEADEGNKSNHHPGSEEAAPSLS